jgi:hypothetical protein
MDTNHYVVKDISGEYATLTDTNTGEELFIALALLPIGTDLGSRLSYSFPEFILED